MSRARATGAVCQRAGRGIAGGLVAAVLAAGLPGSLAGCKKSGGKQWLPPPEKAPPASIGAAEATRGRNACQSYVDRVCQCAAEKPQLAGECELARSRPGALQVSLDALASAGMSEEDRRGAQANARKVVAACIEDDAKLSALGCPRAAAAEKPPQ
jgi:hypothetical protein